ncbi:hypothetical protein [Pseudescherichia sp. L3]|uniref:hypothetical protein n=1 Tax=Pseudescherichia sp. L3 TaxID=2970817 RepID=UPI00215035CE|nr:hypothetical protein [Pseudescherichia sp. L3]MCR4457558.1 hypothetical protein [Pseudescherichia sp. L3]
MSINKKPDSGSDQFCRQLRQTNEGREFQTNGRQTLADGFETRGAQFQVPSSNQGNVGAGRQTAPINLAPTNFQSPKVPKIPAKKS